MQQILQPTVDGRLDRRVGLDVELDTAQVDVVLLRIRLCLLDLRRVATLRDSHAGVDRVAALGERACRESTEAARRARDDDDLFQCRTPTARMFDARSIRFQMIPPLARSV